MKDFFVGEDIMNALQKIKKDFATGEPSEKEFKKILTLLMNGHAKCVTWSINPQHLFNMHGNKKTELIKLIHTTILYSIK